MQAILNELFYGNINPNAKQFARNSEYGKAVKTVSDCEEKLLTLLSGKELEMFEKLMKFLTFILLQQEQKADRLNGFFALATNWLHRECKLSTNLKNRYDISKE